MKVKQRRLRRNRLARALAFAIAAGVGVSAYADFEVYQLNIASQKVGSALVQLGQRAGVQITVPHDIGNRVKSVAINGEYTLIAALEKMLEGTGLVYEFVSDDSVVIKQKANREFNSTDNKRTDTSIFEEIIVTAEKRAESIQGIPIAISAVTGEDLDKLNIRDVRSMQFHVPGLTVAKDNNSTRPTLRGIGSDVANTGAEDGVVVSQDGVPFSNGILFNADLLDIDRVEVLRGPQGTINGRNATGGAINIHSNRPTYDFDGGLKVTLGNYDRFTAEGVLSGPLMGDKLAARLAVSTDRDDGWITNLLSGRKYKAADKQHARSSLLANPTDNLEAYLIVDYLRDRSSDNVFFQIPERLRPDTPTLAEFGSVYPGNIDKRNLEVTDGTPFDREQWNATLRVAWDLSPSVTLTSISGYVDMYQQSGFDCDGTRLRVCLVDPWYYDVRQWSQELTLTAQLTDRMDLIAGGLYLRSDVRETLFLSSQEFLGFTLLPSDELQELSSYGLYSQLRYRLTDSLRLALGVRFTRDEKDWDATLSNAGTSESDSWGSFTPRLALDFTPTDDLTLYASVARGFKAGGFNSNAAPANPFKPETVWNYEIGLKSYWLDRRVRASGAVFYMDYKDLQQNVFGLDGGFLPKIVNAGQAEIKGFEWELSALVTDQLRLGTTGSYLDTQFTKLRTADNLFPEPDEPDSTTDLNIRDLAGNRLTKAPRWQFSLFGEYRVPVSQSLDLNLRADYSRKDKLYFTINNVEALSQEAYGLLNLRASLETTDGAWALTIYSANVLDERYFVSKNFGTGIAPVPERVTPLQNIPHTWSTLGEPRRYGLSLTHKF